MDSIRVCLGVSHLLWILGALWLTYVQTFIAISAVLTRMQSTQTYSHFVLICGYVVWEQTLATPFGIVSSLTHNLLTYLVFYRSPITRYFCTYFSASMSKISPLSQKLYNLRCPRIDELFENFHSTLITHILWQNEKNQSTHYICVHRSQTHPFKRASSCLPAKS